MTDRFQDQAFAHPARRGRLHSPVHAGQVEHNRESTARQYALADRACQLGWSKEQVVIIDEDLGLSGSSTDKRSGFARLTSEVALAHVGIVLGLEVSRLARNNADWYRLLGTLRRDRHASSATTTASTTRRCSTIVCCWV